jgi:hypothetical protein
MKRDYLKPIEKLADFVDDIFVFENYDVKKLLLCLFYQRITMQETLEIH